MAGRRMCPSRLPPTSVPRPRAQPPAGPAEQAPAPPASAPGPGRPDAREPDPSLRRGAAAPSRRRRLLLRRTAPGAGRRMGGGPGRRTSHDYAPFDLRLFCLPRGLLLLHRRPARLRLHRPDLQLLRRAPGRRRLRRRLVLHGRPALPLVAALVAVLHRRSAPGTTGTDPTTRSSGRTGPTTRSTTAVLPARTTRAGATSGTGIERRPQSRAFPPRAGAGDRRGRPAAAPGAERRPTRREPPPLQGAPAYGAPGADGAELPALRGAAGIPRLRRPDDRRVAAAGTRHLPRPAAAGIRRLPAGSGGWHPAPAGGGFHPAPGGGGWRSSPSVPFSAPHGGGFRGGGGGFHFGGRH